MFSLRVCTCIFVCWEEERKREREREERRVFMHMRPCKWMGGKDQLNKINEIKFVLADYCHLFDKIN